MAMGNLKHFIINSLALCALLLGSNLSIAFSFGSTPIRSSRHALSLQPSFRRHTSHQQFPSASHLRSSSSTALAMAPSDNLVTIQQAVEAHGKTNSDGSKNVFIDGSWHMPVGSSPRNGRAEYTSGPRIPGAYYYDIDDIAPTQGSADNPKKLPHMKPSPKLFASAMDQMGISPNDTLYVYATNGCGFYHRAYWTLASCGFHDPSKVKLVQGSLDEWRECGGELEVGVLNDDDYRLFRMSASASEDRKYTCWNDGSGESTVDMEQVLSVVKEESPDTIIVDARSAGRFIGKDPEPRPGLRGGHMPGSLNVPFISLLDPDDLTKFRPMEEVRDIFVKAGVAPLEDGSTNVPKKVVLTCGSGVTAAALAVGLEECGLRKKEDITIFDGSWIEWGGDDDTPIVTTD